MSQPWQALESLNDVATSHLSWRLLLGDSFDCNRDLLVPIKELAAALPVPGRPYEWLEVSEVQEGVLEGYNQKTETYVPVDRRDIVCYEFSFGKLACELASLIGFEVAFERLGGPMYRFRLGHFGNPNGSGFSLYLVKVSDPRRLDWGIDALLAETQRPFVLFLTSNRMLNSRNATALCARGCLIIPLEQAMLRNEDGEWNLSQWARGQLVAFRDRLMPPSKTVSGRFPTPSGSRWSDVEMRFASHSQGPRSFQYRWSCRRHYVSRRVSSSHKLSSILFVAIACLYETNPSSERHWRKSFNFFKASSIGKKQCLKMGAM
jgi:hypothetical protein